MLQPISPRQATVVTDPNPPGFKITIPAGVSITGWDGQPNTQVAIRKVPLDRNPLPPFPGDRVVSSLYMYSFGKQGGGTPSAPVPITYPNDLDLPPGTQVELWCYNEAPDGSRPNAWAQYGTGTVSADGSQVLPDTNPATGQPRFCCGAGYMAIIRALQEAVNNQRGGENLPPEGTCCSDPVEVSTGLFVLTHTGLVLPGRVPIVLSRTYRPRGAPSGPFGPGTSHPYHVLLLVESNLRTLILPGGTRLAFPKQADGTLRNGTDPMVRGAIITETGGVATLRFKDGATWSFGAPIYGTAFLMRQTDRNGNGLAFTRTGSAQNLVTVTESTGRELTLTYDGSNRITSITDPLGRRVTYTYNAAGSLETVSDPAQGLTRYTYDGSGRMLTITDPRNALLPSLTCSDTFLPRNAGRRCAFVMRDVVAFVNLL
jgi:YD repeat-containing protein